MKKNKILQNVDVPILLTKQMLPLYRLSVYYIFELNFFTVIIFGCYFDDLKLEIIYTNSHLNCINILSFFNQYLVLKNTFRKNGNIEVKMFIRLVELVLFYITFLHLQIGRHISKNKFWLITSYTTAIAKLNKW